jgi:hypothetical protein
VTLTSSLDVLTLALGLGGSQFLLLQRHEPDLLVVNALLIR